MRTAARYRDLIHEGARFCVVGAGGVVVTDGGANLLRAVAGMSWLNASVLATVAAIAFTYAGSRYWTFRHRSRTGVPRESLLFFGLAGVGLLIQLGCLGFTVHVLGDSGRLAFNAGLFIGIVLATGFRFWAYRRWVWRAAAPGPEPPVAGQTFSSSRWRRMSVLNRPMRRANSSRSAAGQSASIGSR
jgi:putative flippase GtrA